MPGKTQKISEELHRKLKMLAIQEGKTLQEVTEEVIKDGFKARNSEGNQRIIKNNDKRGDQ